MQDVVHGATVRLCDKQAEIHMLGDELHFPVKNAWFPGFVHKGLVRKGTP